jgi:HK97 family phage prohead protease
MERRFVQECRAEIEGKRLVGHAAVFNQETRIGEFFERVHPEAFDDVLDGDTVLQLEHQGLPLARTTSGTMELRRDREGLVVDADPADTSAGRDLRELVRRGDLYSMSFGFTVAEDAWEKRDDGSHLRTIKRVGRLYDVSVVTFPAYLGTDVSLRSYLGDIPRPPHSPRRTARGQAALIRAQLWKDSRV